jgi:hypothetical protein
VTYNLWSEPGIESDVFKKVLGLGSSSAANPSQDEAEELWCWSVLKTLRADMDTEKLYPPGI